MNQQKNRAHALRASPCRPRQAGRSTGKQRIEAQERTSGHADRQRESIEVQCICRAPSRRPPRHSGPGRCRRIGAGSGHGRPPRPRPPRRRQDRRTSTAKQLASGLGRGSSRERATQGRAQNARHWPTGLGRANKNPRATNQARSRPWPCKQQKVTNKARKARQAAGQRWPRPTHWRGQSYKAGGATGVLPPTGGYGLGRCPARSTAVVSGLGRDHPGLGHQSANAGSWNCKNVWAAAAASSSRASQSPMMARPAAMKMSASDSPSPPPSVPRAG